MKKFETMALDVAKGFAERFIKELEPFCHRIEVAGSIRRKRPEVRDIDLVCLPTDRAGLRSRILRTHPRILSDGEQVIEVELDKGLRLDVWMARDSQKTLFDETPTNYGTLLLCRTGSMNHNRKLAMRAATLGMHWNPHSGLYQNNRCIACETEESIFEALRMEPVAPELRE